MNRYIGPVLGLTLLGISVGFILGLVIGYVFPVAFINADASTLRPEYKEDYVVMVSTAYALDNSLADAKLRLSKIEPNAANATKLVMTIAERAIEQNDARNARNLAVLAVALGVNSPAIRSYMTTIATATPTAATTLAPTTTRTPTPVALLVETATPTPQPTATATVVATATPQPTNTTAPTLTNTPVPQPPTATATRRPPTNTPPPTETPKPSIDFKVIEQRLHTLQENGGCFGRNTYFITVVDKNGVPLPNILVRRVYDGKAAIPPTGAKGPGKTEETTPRYSGDILYVLGDTSGNRFTSEQTRSLSVNEAEIPIPDLITAGYCPNTAECQQRIKDIQLCLGHHSYNITFQRQW